MQRSLLRYLLTVGSFPTLALTIWLRGHIGLIYFITMSDLVSNVAGKGPPALYLKHVSGALVSSALSKTQLGVARLHRATDVSQTPVTQMKLAHTLF